MRPPHLHKRPKFDIQDQRLIYKSCTVSHEDGHHLAVATRESPRSVNGVKGDESLEEPRDNDWGTVKSSSQTGELSP